MNKTPTIILTAVIFLAGGFYAGMTYQKSKTPNVIRQFGSQAGTGNSNGLGFRPVNGEVLEISDNSITIKQSGGESKIIILSDSTKVIKTQEARLSDLTTGETVTVLGSENPDGSITATNIQLNPTFQVIGEPPTD